MTPEIPLPAAPAAAARLAVSRRRRMQRTAIAAATTLVAMLMFYLTYLAGFIPAQVFVIAGGAALALMALFVPVFYSGLNLRFRDPSLFLPQTMCAIVVTSYVMVYAGPARPALALLYFAAMLLSVLRFSWRTFATLAVFVQFCYALVIYLAMEMEGAAFDLRAHLLHWFFLALSLPWLGWLAGNVERMRQRFKINEALYRAVWDNSIDAAVLFDQTGLIYLANSAAARLFGYDADNMRGMPIAALTPARLRAGLAQQLDDYAAHGMAERDWRRFEGVIVTASGRELPVEAALAELGGAERRDQMFGAGGRRLVLFARDISQRHALEAIKDDFIATVSHELRTPLTAVVGAVEALQLQQDVPLAPETQVLLEMAAAGGARLQRLVDTILNLQKMETGGIDFAPEPVRASALINVAIEASRPAAATQGKFLAATQFSKELANDVMVRADPRWIHQVLINLIDNGLKFSPAGATVVTGATISGDRVRFSVIDQGSGVPADFGSRMFSRFARADNSNTRVHGGVGLGLSVCKAAVEGCGGSIGYLNNPVKGTTLWFELPLVRVAQDA